MMTTISAGRWNKRRTLYIVASNRLYVIVPFLVQILKLRSLSLVDCKTLQVMDLPSLKYLHVELQYGILDMSILSEFVRHSFDANASELTGDLMSLIASLNPLPSVGGQPKLPGHFI